MDGNKGQNALNHTGIPFLLISSGSRLYGTDDLLRFFKGYFLTYISMADIIFPVGAEAEIAGSLFPADCDFRDLLCAGRTVQFSGETD